MTDKPKWYYNLWFVLAMLFLVLGPFGLPLVWKHPRWPRLMKGLLTLVVILYTIWVVDVSVRMSRTILQRLHDTNATFSF